jgi:hypothetical protein
VPPSSGLSEEPRSGAARRGVEDGPASFRALRGSCISVRVAAPMAMKELVVPVLSGLSEARSEKSGKLGRNFEVPQVLEGRAPRLIAWTARIPFESRR